MPPKLDITTIAPGERVTVWLRGQAGEIYWGVVKAVDGRALRLQVERTSYRVFDARVTPYAAHRLVVVPWARIAECEIEGEGAA